MLLSCLHVFDTQVHVCFVKCVLLYLLTHEVTIIPLTPTVFAWLFHHSKFLCCMNQQITFVLKTFNLCIMM